MTAQRLDLLNVTVQRNQYDTIPAHHVCAATATTTASQTWLPFLTSWNSTQTRKQPLKPSSRSSSREATGYNGVSGQGPNGEKIKRTGFKNPWPSWYKPTRKQVWDSLEWGEDLDPCIELAASHTRAGRTASKSATSGDKRSRAQIAADLLCVQGPDFAYDPSSGRAKTTWLGHAGILVQLPPLSPGGRPIRCIFDPIFSMRSSPTQMAGPIRSYLPPCTVESLPPIDIFMMSHNHHDHLDYDTVVSLWKSHADTIRFVTPLGNKPFFIECGIDGDRVVELDWWESIQLTQTDVSSLQITCTPCQHNSGRKGGDANETLWSSWYLEHTTPNPYKVYFAGDTGYQFHESPGWPPEPTAVDGRLNLDKKAFTEKNPYPSCPAFQEIADRLGSPDLLLLPVAVGATYSFLRSYVPLPDATSPFPRHKPGMTAANHMPPWDAVHVLQTMTAERQPKEQRAPVAIAMHWGTFVPERTEVLKTLGQLEYACIQQDVHFARSLDDVGHESSQPIFLALNHGQSVVT